MRRQEEKQKRGGRVDMIEEGDGREKQGKKERRGGERRKMRKRKE